MLRLPTSQVTSVETWNKVVDLRAHTRQNFHLIKYQSNFSVIQPTQQLDLNRRVQKRTTICHVMHQKQIDELQ